MKKIEINKFKAFNDTITLDFPKKNFLLYGDNGAGKSSIYDAIKVIFFWEKLESKIPNNLTPEEHNQYKNDLWSSFNNKRLNTEFQLKINDTHFKDFDKTNYQVNMISFSDLLIGGSINLLELLEKSYINIQDSLQFCIDSFETIQEEVNSRLNEFCEEVQIIIDPQDNFSVKIIDDTRKLERKSEIKQYFNEGKINLIVLLLLFSAIYLNKNTSKNKWLVLDDYITSLDTSNRTFIMKYVLKLFGDCQILISTHNVGFFNLMKYIVNNIDRNNVDNWTIANLYEINGKHRFYTKQSYESIKTIKKEYEDLGSHKSDTIDQLGNRIRKKFEILLYEFSKILLVGSVEDSSIILERISGEKSFYAMAGGKNVYNLVDEIEGLIKDVPIAFLKARLQNKIKSYKDFDLKNLKSTLINLKLYQKVTMHPMSHGVIGMASFTAKEIEQSIDLLTKMEEVLEKLVDGNVSSV